METEAGARGRRVFISYARADQSRVEAIVSALAGAGFSVWWDRHIAGGAAYAREIEAELRAADAVVVAWSAASVDSDWVRDEAALARNLGRLIPARLDRTAAPLGFGQYQGVDLSAWNGEAGAPQIGRLIEAVERLAGVEPSVRASVRAASGPTRGPRLGRRALIVAGVAAAPLAVAAWWLARPGGPIVSPAPSARTIAVLPFANLSGDPSQDYFSDGLSDELIDALARLGQLEVVGRTSSFQFKGTRQDSHAIGRKLGVAYLLAGSVRRDGTQVRVDAQLVDTRSGFERWSQTYDRDFKDIFAVQSGIAQAVAQAMKVQLLGGEIAALTLGDAANTTAYDAYLQGRRLFDQGGVEATYREALAKFDQAIAADPGYAAAYAARARVLDNLGDQFVGADKLRATYDLALAAARKAAQLAPNLAETQATLADTLASARLDFAGARRAYARAMVLGAGQADILARSGLFASYFAEFATALAAARRAVVLDPLNPRVIKYLGYDCLMARRYPDAIAAMRRALALSPGTNGAHYCIGEALQFQAQLEAARDEYALEPVRWLRLTGQAVVLRRLGDQAGARGAFQSLIGGTGDVTFYQQAQVHAQWGEPDLASRALTAALAAGDSGLAQLRVDPMLDPLRQEAWFKQLVAKLGLDG